MKGETQHESPAVNEREIIQRIRGLTRPLLAFAAYDPVTGIADAGDVWDNFAGDAMTITTPITMTGKYQTRNGDPARILCVDAPGDRPVVAIVGELVYLFTPSGIVFGGAAGHHLNLIPVPVTHEIDVWVNVYADGGARVHRTKKKADLACDGPRVACVNIKRTVTEGEGL